MKRRLFIAISIPDDIVKMIDGATTGLNLPADFRFSRPETWHVTVTFLGNQEDKDIPGIISAIDETAENFGSPEIVLEKFSLGPPGRKPNMIWLEGDRETSERLAAIKNFLDGRLEKNGVIFEKEKRKFSAHVTLARFGRAPAGLREISAAVDWRFSPRSIDLFESFLNKNGSEHVRITGADFV